MVELGPDAIEPLIGALRAESLREKAVRYLEAIGDPVCLPALAEMLNESHVDLWKVLLKALRKLNWVPATAEQRAIEAVSTDNYNLGGEERRRVQAVYLLWLERAGTDGLPPLPNIKEYWGWVARTQYQDPLVWHREHWE